jgi:hypothetical protein
MKKTILFLFTLVAAVIVLESFGTLKLNKKNGSEPGYTGSPGDTLKNCTVCHGGVALPVSNWITSNIPAEGYTPGKTYTITATNYEFGATRFGFEISPQNLKGDMLGTIVITDTTTTQLVGNGKYITYKSAGVDGQDFKTWVFDWVAPDAATEDVVFYGAFNANFNGTKVGDHTYLSTLKVKSVLSGVIKPNALTNSKLNIYPNPAVNFVNIDFNVASNQDVHFELFDINGKKIEIDADEILVTKRLNISEIPIGTYVLILRDNNRVRSEKILVTH